MLLQLFIPIFRWRRQLERPLSCIFYSALGLCLICFILAKDNCSFSAALGHCWNLMALPEIPFSPNISGASGISLLTEHILCLGFILPKQKDQVLPLFGSSSSCWSHITSGKGFQANCVSVPRRILFGVQLTEIKNGAVCLSKAHIPEPDSMSAHKVL